MESEKVKEIKKALECCKQNEIKNTCEYCSNCPANNWDYETECNVELFQNSLTLINELESNYQNVCVLLTAKNEQIVDLTKENERLKNCIATLERKLDAKESYYNAVKDRALEVFANRLKEKIRNYCGTEEENAYYDTTKEFACDEIDETLKEFLGK